MSDSRAGSIVLHHVVDGPVVPAPAGTDAPVPLLLGPSIGTSTALWAQVVPALARDRRVVRWDLPGHGGTSADLIPASIADLGQLVIELADDLGIERFDYAGDSLGGAVGTWLAAHQNSPTAPRTAGSRKTPRSAARSSRRSWSPCTP